MKFGKKVISSNSNSYINHNSQPRTHLIKKYNKIKNIMEKTIGKTEIKITCRCPTCNQLRDITHELEPFTISGKVEHMTFCERCGDVFLVGEIDLQNQKYIIPQKLTKKQILNFKL